MRGVRSCKLMVDKAVGVSGVPMHTQEAVLAISGHHSLH